MLRRNKISLPIFFLATSLLLVNSSVANPQPPANSQSSPATAPASSEPATASPAPPAGTVSPGAAPSVSPNPAPAGDSGDSGTFVFRKQVEEVVLHATVVDDKQRIVTSLEQGDFNIYENGSPQTITSFRHEDIPVAMGIVVDNSGLHARKAAKSECRRLESGALVESER